MALLLRTVALPSRLGAGSIPGVGAVVCRSAELCRMTREVARPALLARRPATSAGLLSERSASPSVAGGLAERAEVRRPWRLALLAPVCLLLWILLGAPLAVQAAESVVNIAHGSFRVAGLPRTSESDTSSIVIRTPSTLEFLSYAPLAETAEAVPVAPASYLSAGGYNPLPPPLPLGATTPLALSAPLPLVTTTVYHEDEPFFLRLTDHDQNLDPGVVETVVVTISLPGSDESEIVRLTETGPDTGVFTGYIQSSETVGGLPGNGILLVKQNAQIHGKYTDVMDGTDTSVAAVMVDPYGVVFDTSTGLPVTGATVTMIDATTGRPATVYGDDGISLYPPSVISGETATDSSGRVYTFPPGFYRFPYLQPGRYLLKVTPPPTYLAPSTVATADIQDLPGAPYAIVKPGSRGEEFVINPGPAIHIDLPIDPIRFWLHLTKTASKATVAIGDFLQYKLTVKNTGSAEVGGIAVSDLIPGGFRYCPGSTKFDGKKADDPVLSVDGRTLSFSVGALAADKSVVISYVLEVAAGAPLGRAVNTAVANGTGVARSNIVQAEVQVTEDFFSSKSIVVGRVFPHGCSRDGVDGEGLAGVRMYLEDGTYVVTDKNGMYHFEGLKPGTHLVQLDLETVPKGYELISCEENSRIAQTPFSQFVDLQGGTMWRADFFARQLPPQPLAPPEKISGIVAIEMASVLGRGAENGAEVDYTVTLKVGEVPIDNLRLTVVLPVGVSYQPGRSLRDGAPLADPEIMENNLTYRLGAAKGGWSGKIGFTGNIAANLQAGELVTKAMLTFNTADEKNRRTPLVDTILQHAAHEGELLNQSTELRNIKGDSGNQEVVVTILRKAEISAEEEMRKERLAARTMPEFDGKWLAQAESGLAFVWPYAGYYPPIPSTKIAVKHDPRKRLTLLLNGTELDPLYLDGDSKRGDNQLAVSFWTGVHLNDGDNLFEAIEYGADGHEEQRISRTLHYSTSPVKAEVVPSQSLLIADGKTPPVVAIVLTDKDGKPAREGLIGEYQLDSPYLPLQQLKDLQENPLLLSNSARLKYLVGEDGIARIELQPTTRSGEAVLRFNFSNGESEVRTWLAGGEREWIIVGFGEGTAGYNTLSGNMENLQASQLDDEYYQDGRLAFFAKGMIKGQWLLTVAYDSAKAGTRQAGSLHGSIDPQKYYTIYGDASTQQYEAASARKLYLKIERDRFYALFGDYDTGLSVTELSRYNRNFNGLKAEMKGDKYDFNLFVADTIQAFVKDELRGDGTSGLYRLSRQNIVANSEKITVESRDRYKSEEVLASQTMNRFVDYDIDYDAGTLFFKSPIANRDQNFNPIYIVVDYESADLGDKSYNYGGRGAVHFMEKRLEIGATHIHEGRLGGEGNLYGLDSTVKITDSTTVKAEVATTVTDFKGVSADGTAYLAEVSQQGKNLTGKAYWREQDSAFGLGQQMGSETGTRKIGLEGTYRWTDNISVLTTAFRQYTLATDAARDMAELQAKFTEQGYSLHAGLRHAQDNLGNDETNTSEQFTGGVNFNLGEHLILRVEHDQSLRSSNNNPDFPTRTLLGADYKFNESVTAFIAEEFSQGAKERTELTRVGLRSSPWSGGQLSSSLEQQATENGTRLFSVSGLKQSWQLSKKWSIDAGLDRSATIKQPGNTPININVPAAAGSTDFTAMSGGASYKEEKWSWTGRIEGRTSDTDDKYSLTTGLYGEVSAGLALGAAAQIFKTSTVVGSKATNGDLRFSLASRPRNSDWIVLDRIDYLLDRQQSKDFTFDNWRLINNLNANWKRDRKTQISLQYGAKYVNETIDEHDYSGYTDLCGFEGRYDLTKKWDVGLTGKVLHSWQSKQIKYGSGVSLGYNVVKNAWISVGYNVVGFTDRDFSAAEFTAQGVFVKFRFKVDQTTVREALQAL